MTEVKLEKMGKMKWEMIFWIAVTLFFIVNGQDVTFQYDGCYSDRITMTAVYTGSGTLAGVEWFYSGKTGSNLFIEASSCTVLGGIPSGYPAADKMKFQCPSTNSDLEPNTFKLTVTGLEGDDLENSWGATFSLSTGSPPAVVNDSFAVCVSDCGCKSLNNCDISKGGCIGLWILISAVIVGVIIVIVLLILHFVIGVRFPCGGN